MFPIKQKEIKQIINVFDTTQIKKGQYYRVEDTLSCNQFDCVVDEVQEGKILLRTIGSNKEIIILPDQTRYIANRLRLVVDEEESISKDNKSEGSKSKNQQQGKIEKEQNKINRQDMDDIKTYLEMLFPWWNFKDTYKI